MPIVKINIENYRGIGKQQTLEFAKPDGKTPGCGITVIVGSNNSGKSTVLRAVFGMYSNESTFVADLEDRRGKAFPKISLEFEKNGQMREISTKTVDRSAYLEKTGALSEAVNASRFIPARRPWRDRFSRQAQYTRDSYENQFEAQRKSDEFHIDNQFANALHILERKKEVKDHGAVRNVVGIRCGALSGNMKVSFQAARSIG